MTLPDKVREAMARAIREEIVRQHRDDERRKGPLFSHDYEEMVAPTQILDAALSALEAAGWVCVPVELTEKMRAAFYSAKENGITVGRQFGLHRESAGIAWRAMLTASRHKEKNDG